MLFKSIIKKYWRELLAFGILSFILAFFFHQAFMEKWVQYMGQLIVGLWLVDFGLDIYKRQKLHDKLTSIAFQLSETTRNLQKRILKLSAASLWPVHNYLVGDGSEFAALDPETKEALFSSDIRNFFDYSENAKTKLNYFRDARTDTINLNYLILELLELERELITKSRLLINALRRNSEITEPERILYFRLRKLETCINHLSGILTSSIEFAERNNLDLNRFESTLADLKDEWVRYKSIELQ